MGNTNPRALGASRIKFLLAAILLIPACGGDGDKTTFKPDSVWSGHYSTAKQARTPKGITVLSKEDARPTLFPLMDQGIDELAVEARKEGYEPITHGEVQVALFPTSRYCIAPGFLIADPSNTWDNLPPPNDFDKDPRPGHTMLCAAGLHPGGNILVVADASSHMVNIVHYEGEHFTLMLRDAQRWVNTSGVHSHPIFGTGQRLVSDSQKKHEAFLVK